MQEAGQSEQFQALLKDIEGASLEGGALDKACSQLQELVSGLQAPPQLYKDVGRCAQPHGGIGGLPVERKKHPSGD